MNKKKLLRLAAVCMACLGMGAFAFSGCKTKDSDKDDNTQQETGNTENTGNTGNTGNTEGNTGNTDGNTGNTDGNTGNTEGNTGNTEGNTGNTGSTGDTGNTGSTGDKDKDKDKEEEEVKQPTAPTGAPQIIRSIGDLEAGYVTWSAANGADWYNVYVKQSGGAYTKLDGELVREYKDKSGSTYFRADAVGLKAGTYSFRVIPTATGGEENANLAADTAEFNVKAHTREGFGFVQGTSSGAYNEDGTLKSNAQVVYITQMTKNTVKTTVNGIEYEGFQNILYAMKAQKKNAPPLCVRMVGDITDPQVLEKGDLLVDTIVGGGLTIEGIGADTYADGWGIRIKNCSNVEIRNLGLINCDSNEGDDVGLQQGNDHVWVHNCDFFYGHAGSDADQKKGDGALDTKKSTYVTHSYNRFYDTGKSNLQGMKDEKTTNRITYHHNWYDHSDSRHPRIRTCTVHIYNNYFDGNAKYGVGVTLGASAFVENNYFRSSVTMKPMLSSGQGTDAKGEGTFSGEAGGIIKAYGNVFDGKYTLITQNTAGAGNDIDCYEASSRNEQVPATVKTISGGTAYNNFDTSTSDEEFYDYQVDDAQTAKEKVEKYAGRIEHGDFVWEFTDADDASYAVDEELKSALMTYKTSIVKIDNRAVKETMGTGSAAGSETEDDPDGGNEGSGAGQLPEGTNAIYFDSGMSYAGVSVTGNFSSNSKYNVGGVERAALKMESATEVRITLTSGSKLKIHISDAAKKIKVDGTAYTTSDGVVTVDLGVTATAEKPVTVIITKGETTNLQYIEIE